MGYVIVAFLMLMAAAPRPADAQVHVEIGIHLPAPPPLVVVPRVPSVRYVPQASFNLFVYGGQYWAFVDGGWYVSAAHHGPWMVVAPQFVPRPLLLVPVRYYRARPSHWKQWHHQAPPRWDREWGREWADKREWRRHVRDDDGHQGWKRERHRRR
jgi:hypothetical protein